MAIFSAEREFWNYRGLQSVFSSGQKGAPELPAKRFAMLLGLIVALALPLAAQEIQDPSAFSELRLTGEVRTADSIPVPGATVRALQTGSGKAWVSWTNETGKFEFPALPAGHYRVVEASMLGFASGYARNRFIANFCCTTRAETSTSARWRAINAPPATPVPPPTPPANPAASSETAKSQPAGALSRNSCECPAPVSVRCE